MNDAAQGQIARLRAEIDDLEAQVATLEADVLDIQRELDEFTVRYNQIVRPKVDRLDLIQQMIKDLEDEQNQAEAHPSYTETWKPPPGYVSVEEQFNRVWRSPQNNASEPIQTLHSDWKPPKDYVPVEEQFRRVWGRPIKNDQPQDDSAVPRSAPSPVTSLDPQALKNLYRKLARRFHPDLTTDPRERERRNRLMAEINDAYSRRDSAALLALDKQPDASNLDQPLATIQVHQLRKIRDQLANRLDTLKQERIILINSEMMELKVQASLLARSRRDLLLEMAEQLERDYVAQLDKLDDLRRASGNH